MSTRNRSSRRSRNWPGAEDLDPRSREFNRQRNAVQSLADVRENLDVLVGIFELLVGASSALQEKCKGRRNVKRGHPIGLFAVKSQTLTARCKNLHVRAAVQDRRDDAACRFDQVFAIVKDEQQSFWL